MSRSHRFEVFRYGVIGLALVIALAAGRPGFDAGLAVPLFGLGTAALVLPLHLSLTHKVSVATAVFFGAALLLPAPEAAALAAACELASALINVTARSLGTRTAPPAALVGGTMAFNSAHAYLAVLLAGRVLEAGGGGAPALIAAAVTMHVVNRGVVTVAVALKTNTSWLKLVRDTQQLASVTTAGLYLCGYLVFLLARWSPPAVALAVIPVAIIYTMLRTGLQLRQETITAVERMADMVDRRDPYTFEHSRRVAEYAVAVGRRLGLSREDLEVLRLAGAVHDLGKIGVPDSILLKPGRLSPEEARIMEDHPRIGHDILSEYREYGRVRDLVLTHHERYAGGGYPGGVRAASLPLIAQVLPVADTLDAMTSARPYRRALPWATALDELDRGAGAQWNPQVVAAAIAVYGHRREVRGPVATRTA